MVIEFFNNLEPIMWTTLASVASVGISLLLYCMNKRAFNILHGIPYMDLLQIKIEPQKEGKHKAHIQVRLCNPASYDNLIVATKLVKLPGCFPFEKYQKDRIRLKALSFEQKIFSRECNNPKWYKPEFILITLIDIKKNKIRELFRLKNINADT